MKGYFVLILFMLMWTDAAAQSERNTRFTVGGAVMLTEPKEEFRQNVDNGIGGAGTLIYHLHRSGMFNLRFDGAGLAYGRETKRVPFSETVGGRVLVDVTTTNYIADFSIGPELAVPSGFVRPYINAAFAGLLFRTSSSVEGIRESNDEPIASTTNHSDWTRAWVFGGGLRIPLGSRTSRVTLDLGARYHRGSEASYLREGSIRDNPDGSITVTPLRSETPFMIYSIGIQYRIPFGSSSPCPGFLC